MNQICLLTDDAEFGLNLRKSLAACNFTVRIILDQHKFYTLSYCHPEVVIVALFKTGYNMHFIQGLRKRTELPIMIIGEYTPQKAAQAL